VETNPSPMKKKTIVASHEEGRKKGAGQTIPSSFFTKKLDTLKGKKKDPILDFLYGRGG